MSDCYAPGLSIDRYRIERELGSGAAGVVLLARHETLETLHAIKVLREQEPVLAQRMVQEAQLQGELRHPNVVSVSDFLDLDGRPAIVQEYVNGPSLAELLTGDALPIDRIHELATGILSGVAAAHDAGMIHRDLKPANILIDQTGPHWVPKIADFGLVKRFATPGAHKTQSGSVIGTPGYMAPEQMKDASTVDTRADVFSLGVVLYEMLTGATPFPLAPLSDLYDRVTTGEYTPIAELRTGLSESIQRTIARALVSDPNARAKTAGELLSIWNTGRASPATTHLTWNGDVPPKTMGWEMRETAERPNDTGERIGRYAIEDLLGEGGWGRVYRARMDGPVGFQKAVAVKVLNRSGNPEQANQDLVNEARLGGLLKHPNIVEVYDLGLQDEAFYIAMEWVRGGTVRERVCDTGPLSPRAVVELGQQVCAGLDHAHGLTINGSPAGLVHRDLKPSNLLVDPNGLIKIADFGIATTHQMVDQSGQSVLIRGTPGYMAPEQQWGDAAAIGPHTDIYALGATLIELLTGQRLTQRTNGIELRTALLNSDSPDDLKQVLLRCIHLEPEERFQSAEALGNTLSRLAVHGKSLAETLQVRSSVMPTPSTQVQTQPVQTSTPATTPPSTSRAPLVAALIACLLLLLFAGVWLLPRDPAATPQDQEVTPSTFALTYSQASDADATLFQDAVTDFLRGEFGLADRRLLSLSQAYPDDPSLQFLNALILAERDEVTQFRDVLTHNVRPKMAPNSHLAHVVTTITQQLEDPKTNRLKQWRTTTADQTEPFWHYVSLFFELLFEPTVSDEYLQRIADAVAKWPDALLFRILLIEQLWTSGRAGPAEVALREALTQSRSNPILVSMRILQWIQLEDYHRAKQELDALLALDPNEGQLFSMKASVLIQLGDTDGLKAHLRLLEGPTLSPRRRAKFLQTIALDLAHMGRIDEAMELYDQCRSVTSDGEILRATWTCQLQASTSALLFQRFELANEWHKEMMARLLKPNISPIHAQQMRNFAQYTQANLAAHHGDMKTAWETYNTLDAQDPALFGTHTFAKDHFLQRLRIQLLAAENNQTGLEQALNTMLPEPSIITGPISSHGPDGRLADWARAHLARLSSDKAKIEDYAQTVLKHTEVERSIDHFLHPDTLVLLAEAAHGVGSTEIAIQLLDTLALSWEQLDRDLPVAKRASDLRSTLGLKSPPSYAPPKAAIDVLPLENDRRVCSHSNPNPCPDGQQEWCALTGEPQMCCPFGLIPTDEPDTCTCAPGGSSVSGLCPAGDSEAFRQTVSDRIQTVNDDLIRCYQRAFFSDKPIEGLLTIRFELGPQGQVLPLGPQDSALYNSPVQTCIHRTLRRTKFSPPVDGHAIVSIPLKFEP